MVLGPFIQGRDFSNIIGCMALVWILKNNVYTFRVAKEAVWTNVVWTYKPDFIPTGETNDNHIVTLVGSTAEILDDSLDGIEGHVEFDRDTIKTYDEGRIYRVEPTGLVDEGAVPIYQAVTDEFSSAIVEEPVKTINELPESEIPEIPPCIENATATATPKVNPNEP
jgi:hypothetical protein